MSLPNEIAPADVTDELTLDLIERKKLGPVSLGMHPEEGLPIYVKEGPFGTYLQLGENPDADDPEAPKPKRVGLPKTVDATTVSLDQAMAYLALPRRLGHHPETGKVVNAGMGRFGPYVLHDKMYGNFGKKTHTYEFNGQSFNVLTITLDAAVDMLKNTKRRAAPTPIRELGKHPADGETIGIYEGRYGMYVKHGKINATIPKEREVDSVTLEEAVDWLAIKAAKGGGGRRKATKKKSAKKKASRKKKASKKKAAKKQAE